MPKMIQIRNVPDKVHAKLKARAKREGMSLSDYLRRDLERAASRPSMQEWLDQLQKRKPIDPGIRPEVIIRELRDSR